jgi:hypothetical protein
MPTDKDVNGNPNRAEFDRRVKEYKEKDNIAYPELMKACYKNPKLKVFAKLLTWKRLMKFWLVSRNVFMLSMMQQRRPSCSVTLLWFSWKDTYQIHPAGFDELEAQGFGSLYFYHA